MDRFSLASGYLRHFYCLTVESRPQECLAQPGLCGGGRDDSGGVVGHRAVAGAARHRPRRAQELVCFGGGGVAHGYLVAARV